MKKYLPLLLLVSILVIGVFGFSLMNHGTNHTFECVASSTDNTSCTENIIIMSAHHIQAYILFFSVTYPTSFVLLFLLLVFLLLSTWVFYIKHQSHISANLSLWQVLHNPERLITLPRKITRWLSLFENSPSLHKISFTIFNFINLCKQKNLKIIKATNSLIQL